MSIDTGIRDGSDAPAQSEVRSARTHWTVTAIISEWAAVALCSHVALLAYSALVPGSSLEGYTRPFAPLIVACLYSALCVADNHYELLGEGATGSGFMRGAAAVGTAFVIFLTFEFAIGGLGAYPRGLVLAQLATAVGGQLLTRGVLSRAIDDVRLRGRWDSEKFAVLATPDNAEVSDLCRTLSCRQDQIVRYYQLPPDGALVSPVSAYEGELARMRLECRRLRVDAVLILFDARSMSGMRSAVSAMSDLPVRILLIPIEMKEYLPRNHFGGSERLRMLELPCGPRFLRDRLLKRLFDIVVASAMLTILWPMLLVVAALIKLDSRGPVLFRQMRHGFNNEPINVIKFRSMTTIGDGSDRFQQTVRNDPRVTRIGRIIRRTNIDELPQLFNVLKGEMSIVGPRPHAVAHNDMFAMQIRRLPRRHIVKPGITGWAQVNGLRGETDTLDKMQQRIEYDLYYIDNWSLLLDVKILFMTAVSTTAYANAY
jgi:Undecaprenyl-phosphate glucose phosphotransferase